MNRVVAICFALALLSAPALAAWDWANPTYATFATQIQMDGIAGITGSSPTAIAVDTDGGLLVEDDPSGSGGSLIKINAAGAGAGGSVILPESTIEAVQLPAPTGDLDIDKVLVASDGTIYLLDHDPAPSVEEVIKITRGGTPTPSNVFQLDGMSDIVLDEANSRFLTAMRTYYGATANGVKAVAIPAGTVTDAATDVQILAASGAAGMRLEGCALLPGNKLAIFDEASAENGSDSVLIIANPGASPTITQDYPTSFFTSAPGFTNLVSTPQGDMISWDQYAAGGAQLTIIPSGAAAPVTFSQASLLSSFGSASAAMGMNDQGRLAVRYESAPSEKLTLFLADCFQSNAVYTMTFQPVSEVADWNLFN